MTLAMPPLKYDKGALFLGHDLRSKKEICRFVFEDIRVQITCLQAAGVSAVTERSR